jgi:hypothetical protein
LIQGSTDAKSHMASLVVGGGKEVAQKSQILMGGFSPRPIASEASLVSQLESKVEILANLVVLISLYE